MATKQDYRVYKYRLQLFDRQIVKMPSNSRILSIQGQHGTLTMWALVDVNSEPVVREFFVFGTGHPVPAEMVDRLAFVGTVQMNDGLLVWHVFEDKAE